MIAHDVFPTGQPGDQVNQRDGDDAVEHRGEDEGFNRVEADEIDEQSREGAPTMTM